MDATITNPIAVIVGETTGAPLVGTEVLFEVLTTGSAAPPMTLASQLNGQYSRTASNLTGPDGKAVVYLRNGTLAGLTRVRISVLARPLSSTIELQVLPGAAFRLDPGPEDTAVVIGGTFTSPARVMDRYDNVRPHSITLTVHPPLAASSSGRSITGIGFSRGAYTVSAVPFAVTESLSVVPAGVLAGASNRGIETFNTDGSSVKSILTTLSGDWIAWSVEGNEIAFGGGNEDNVYVVDLQGNFRLAAPSHLGAEWAPQYAGNGQHIYLSLFDDPIFRIGRVLRDGTGFEVVPGLETTEAYEPTVSVNGILVYRGAAGLVRRNLSTGASVNLGFGGFSPRWSADGSMLAYLDGTTRALWVVAADGSGRRAVTTTGGLPGEFVNSIDWSPDKQWIVANASFFGRVVIVQVATGVVVRLPFAGAWGSMTWKPQ